jgi:hypothetical protein
LKDWMKTDKNYIILTATLNIKKQMQFVFHLYGVFIINMFQFITDVQL